MAVGASHRQGIATVTNRARHNLKYCPVVIQMPSIPSNRCHHGGAYGLRRDGDIAGNADDAYHNLAGENGQSNNADCDDH